MKNDVSMCLEGGGCLKIDIIIHKECNKIQRESLYLQTKAFYKIARIAKILNE